MRCCGKIGFSRVGSHIAAFRGCRPNPHRIGTAQGISGKAVTPFLLARVNALTGGDSLAANVALVLNNARLAAQVAVADAAM